MNISDTLARQLLDAAPDPSVVIDGSGVILYANSRVKDVLGYLSEELVGRHMDMLLPERFRADHPAYRTTYFGNPAPRPMGSGIELYALCKDGHEIPVEISLSPVSTDDGHLVTATVRDVSTQKDLERQLRDASRAKSRFLAAASHDLRQPIQALNLLNSVARRAAGDDALKTIIGKQQKSLDSMARLLNALLDISKLEAGIVRPDITNCAVQEIFEDLRAEFDEQAKTKGLEFIVEQCSDVAKSDARLLTQILENFISNAIRYTKEGFIRLRCLHQEASIRLEVLDTGMGISPDDIGEIFEEFHQVDTGKTRPEGLGLGLSIVKRTAELLGCELDVSSRPGEGSVFSVVVPQGKKERTAARMPEVNSEGVRVTGLVLVVDDEPSVLDATSLFLTLEGFEVVTASCQHEVLDQIAVQAPDLIITDYHLRGGETGADIIRAARRFCRFDMPVILVSGDTSDAVISGDFKEAAFLTKPVDTHRLLMEIRSRIAR